MIHFRIDAPALYNIELLQEQAAAYWGDLLAGLPNEHEDGGLFVNFYFLHGAPVSQGDVEAFLAGHDGAALSTAEIERAIRQDAHDGLATHTFAGLTADEAEAWIDSNVADLPSAIVALKHLARAIIFLRDRE